MCADKIKVRAAVWIEGRQRQKVKYLSNQQEAEKWKEETESYMQQIKVIKEMDLRFGQDSSQSMALKKVIKEEGRKGLCINDCLQLLTLAGNYLRVHLGTDYPFVMDATDLNDYYQQRIQEHSSHEELAAETLLLKLFFQWCGEEGSNVSNKVQTSFDKIIYENNKELAVKKYPYMNSVLLPNTETVDRDSEIRKLQVDGLTQKEIAKVLGVNQSTVSRALRAERS